jgi:hydroxypyruvate reductase
VAETPKPGDPALSRCSNVVIGGNRLALGACERAAREAGFNTMVLSSTIEGETREIARMHGAIGREIREAGAPLAPPACVISGGETTVTLRGGGKGGRNQEFALAAALEIAGLRGLAVFSGGTDGTDGPTDAAGAIAFGDTVARGTAAGLGAAAHLRANDAYPFFDRLGDLVRSGPTGTNVMDLHLVLVTT